MHSPSFRKFKSEMGQANHFLITIMVGLDAVEDGAVKREDFHAAWNPQNTISSVRRSKQYALKSALSWAVDNLDMYLRLANRLPRLYSEKESQEIAKTKHSVYQKFRCIINNHPEIDVCLSAYVDLLICWRNNTTHFDAENMLLPVSQRYFSKLKENKGKDQYCETYNLNISAMIDRFSRGVCPTFKEVATLINATIHFVEILDNLLLQSIDQPQYLESQLMLLLKKDPRKASIFSRHNTTVESREKRIKQLLITAGLREEFFNDSAHAYLHSIANMSEEEFKKRADVNLN